MFFITIIIEVALIGFALYVSFISVRDIMTV